MKKVVVLLLGMLLISPLVWAGVEIQDYSGFDRFVDNVKMFFSFGDGKVRLALEIRGREVGSAMNNFEDGDEEGALRNLERAMERLLFVQEKVSVETSGDVMASVDEVVGGLDDGISDDFDLYKLEEEKTQLTAELVVEVEGSEGQTLTREVVRNEETGRNEVRITIEGESGEQTRVIESGSEGQIQEQIRAREIETRMGEIDVEVGEWVVVEGVDVDLDRTDPDATPKTPIPTDGSICCKKTKDGETRYHWDYEDDCLNPAKIKGEVVNNDVCVALGSEVLDEEDPESWGSVEGGVPEECVAQGAYDDESCGEIMAKLPVCCKETTNGEIEYKWIPGNICVAPDKERMEDSFCVA